MRLWFIILICISSLCLAEHRGNHWPTVRRSWLKNHPICAYCGADTELQVHHIVPFHLDPGLEYDTNNFITLCRTCHFRIGHFGNWQKINPNIRRDCVIKFRLVYPGPILF